MRNRIFIYAVMALLCVSPAYAKQKSQWNEYRSTHFSIYYKDAPMDFVKSVEQSAEQYYEEITRNLGFTRYQGWSFDRRAAIYIYSDKDDYVQGSRQQGWSHGAANARQKVIQTFPSAHGFFDSVLPHEMGHIIFREFIGFNAPVPIWMEEGVAMYQEKAKRWGANKAVAEAIKNKKFIPLDELSQVRLYNTSDDDLVDLFYAESASIIYYMITEFGQQRFVNLCRQLKDGQTFEMALTSAYVRFDNIGELNKAWMDYVQRQ